MIEEDFDFEGIKDDVMELENSELLDGIEQDLSPNNSYDIILIKTQLKMYYRIMIL